MKKFISASILTVALFCVVISCSKKTDNPVGSYTCHCTFTLAGMPAVDLPFTNVTKSTAQSSCTQAQATYNATPGVGATCTIQ